MERRTGYRMDVELACRVWQPGIATPSSNGVTVNMSRSGALVSIREDGSRGLPGVGQMLELEMPLPVNEAFRQRCLLCQASVVRVLRTEPGDYLVAFKFHQLRFRELRQPRGQNGTRSMAAGRKLVVM